MKISIHILYPLIYFGCLTTYQLKGQSSQNPSPMVEHIRLHERIANDTVPGLRAQIVDVLDRPVEIFIPPQVAAFDSCAVLIHFLGASYVAEYAVAKSGLPLILATVNLGGGSSRNEKPFLEHGAFNQLIDAINVETKESTIYLKEKIYLSAFSAGYGAIRAILQEQDNWKRIKGILLLDGLHTGYLPDGLPVAEGGELETPPLRPFLEFAALALEGKKKFVFNHSEIFPGTFASTTECADFLISELGLERNPVLKAGPLGMQQVGETIKGKLMINAFAGNSAPDHVDHYHALFHFLPILAED